MVNLFFHQHKMRGDDPGLITGQVKLKGHVPHLLALLPVLKRFRKAAATAAVLFLFS